MRRQFRQDILVTKWIPEMGRAKPNKEFYAGSSEISIWLLKQMKKYDLIQADLTRNKDISGGTLRHLLAHTKGRVRLTTIKKLSLALASAVSEKDYLEFLLEALEVTGQSDAFPSNQVLNLQRIILSKE